MSNKITPIQNKQLLDTVANELKNMNEAYYLIYCLILETGMPLEFVPTLKIKDIKNSPITFTPSHKTVRRSEFISPALLKNLKAFAGERDDDSLAFTAFTDTTKAFPIRNFQKALIRASEICGLEQPITALALRKTYILNVFLRERNYNKIYALTKCRSIKQVYDYLNLEAPEPDNAYLSSHTVKDVLAREKTISKTLKHTTKVLSAIESNIENEQGLSYEYCQEAMKLSSDIEAALTRFEDLINNPSALKDLYDRSKRL